MALSMRRASASVENAGNTAFNLLTVVATLPGENGSALTGLVGKSAQKCPLVLVGVPPATPFGLSVTLPVSSYTMTRRDGLAVSSRCIARWLFCPGGGLS